MGGVSAQGKKRGRAKNTLKKKNLNIGQRIGWGKLKYNWPGLTSAVVEGSGKETKVDKLYSGFCYCTVQNHDAGAEYGSGHHPGGLL